MNNKIIYQENLKRYEDCYTPAIFLDRDGVIIKDQNYISETWASVDFQRWIFRFWCDNGLNFDSGHL